MGLGDCPKCWNGACTCPDGYGWSHMNPDQLERIASSVREARAASAANYAARVAEVRELEDRRRREHAEAVARFNDPRWETEGIDLADLLSGCDEEKT